LREEAAQALMDERKRGLFVSIEDLVERVPELRKNELQTLAEIGALNSVGSSPTQNVTLHRRDALWQVERAVRRPGPLLEGIIENGAESERRGEAAAQLAYTNPAPSPLARMNDEERLVADFRGTGLTVGPHPMAYRRSEMQALGVQRAIELKDLPNGKYLRVAGCIIARQRPGTAQGFVFLSLEDETGVANAIITPDLFEKNRLLLVREQFLMIEGKLQNLDNVISVKAHRVLPVKITRAPTESHDFH
jgi:error-prone DNA polymerase